MIMCYVVYSCKEYLYIVDCAVYLTQCMILGLNFIYPARNWKLNRD